MSPFIFYTGQKGERRKYFFLHPSRDAIDEKSFEEGTHVSSIRVVLSLLNDAAIVYVPYSFLNTSIPVSVFFALFFALVTLFNGKTLGRALLKFGVEFKDNKAIRTVLRGILIMTLFNRRFLFDRLMGAEYDSTVKK